MTSGKKKIDHHCVIILKNVLKIPVDAKFQNTV
jgi:hypothetical protein